MYMLALTYTFRLLWSAGEKLRWNRSTKVKSPPWREGSESNSVRQFLLRRKLRSEMKSGQKKRRMIERRSVRVAGGQIGKWSSFNSVIQASGSGRRILEGFQSPWAQRKIFKWPKDSHREREGNWRDSRSLAICHDPRRRRFRVCEKRAWLKLHFAPSTRGWPYSYAFESQIVATSYELVIYHLFAYWDNVFPWIFLHSTMIYIAQVFQYLCDLDFKIVDCQLRNTMAMLLIGLKSTKTWKWPLRWF